MDCMIETGFVKKHFSDAEFNLFLEFKLHNSLIITLIYLSKL